VNAGYTPQELLICVVARLLDGVRHVAVGASSPIPGSAALLVRARSGGAVRVSVLGSRRHNVFTDGGRELFDCAGQGRIDAFFLGGGQIDGQGNVNLVGTGGYPDSEVRFPGSFGSAYMYFMVPRVILFREEHSRRVLVPKVDFVSAPGVSAANVYRPGGACALVTGLAAFAFERDPGRFRLESLHPGHDLQEVLDNTGFDFGRPEDVPITPPPEPEALALLRGRVREEIAEVYPNFAARAFTAAA
jgi:glutaconate CoA-transferase subunit B